MKIKFGCQKGTAAIEAALVLSFVLVPLLLGVIDASLFIYNSQVIANASREGARLGIKMESLDESAINTLRERIIAYCRDLGLINWGGPTDPEIVIDVPVSPITYEDSIAVTVTFNYSPLFLSIFNSTLTLSETTFMKMEGL